MAIAVLEYRAPLACGAGGNCFTGYLLLRWKRLGGWFGLQEYCRRFFPAVVFPGGTERLSGGLGAETEAAEAAETVEEVEGVDFEYITG